MGFSKSKSVIEVARNEMAISKVKLTLFFIVKMVQKAEPSLPFFKASWLYKIFMVDKIDRLRK